MEALLQISELRRPRKKKAASIRWAEGRAAGMCKHNAEQITQTSRASYENKHC